MHSVYVSSFWRLCLRTPTGALPWTSLGASIPRPPVLSPLSKFLATPLTMTFSTNISLKLVINKLQKPIIILLHKQLQTAVNCLVSCGSESKVAVAEQFKEKEKKKQRCWYHKMQRVNHQCVQEARWRYDVFNVNMLNIDCLVEKRSKIAM